MLNIYFIILIIIPFINVIQCDDSTTTTDNNGFGCGPMGINIDTVLRGLDRQSFIPCCVQHDLCYRTCNRTRSQCDCAFYRCFQQSCVSRYPKCIDCYAYTIEFFKLVRIGGLPSYIHDQKNNNCTATYDNKETNDISMDKNYIPESYCKGIN
ncbi:unnamed protein product [Adineta steineri]|uniref:Uncharacterized protein n=1 Tax=Adineta steineri TaxID=433720 RepID=A0A813P7A1_9BILA|nr:unnamed protein product [Adineta steineri]CAF3803359.1 unnamed protein product [Adineta steineri]